MNSKKVLYVKFGWSDYYRGGPVNGNFEGLKWMGGAERFNFRRASDRNYYCYISHYGEQPIVPGKKLAPKEQKGWTVICLSRHPDKTGIHIVGWYENATLLAPEIAHPDHDDWWPTATYVPYVISATKAYLVPPEKRTQPFSHPAVRQAKYAWLRGPKAKATSNNKQVLALLSERINALKDSDGAILNPGEKNLPDHGGSESDPLGGYGTAEHRKRVEKAAVEIARRKLKSQGYSCKSVESQNCGYDLLATRGRNPAELHVEVKGTSSSEQRFFLTPNEFGYQRSNQKHWRLALVTSALASNAVCKIFNQREFKKKFECEPGVYIARPKQ